MRFASDGADSDIDSFHKMRSLVRERPTGVVTRALPIVITLTNTNFAHSR